MAALLSIVRRSITWTLNCALLAAFLALPNLKADSISSPEAWQRAIGPWTWSFPRDHGAHPNFKTEWWYFTGNLEDESHRKFGYQLTIFRQGVQFTPAQTHSHWAVRDFYFGHFTISDLETGKFHVAEKVSRGALGEAYASSNEMDVKLGNWTIDQEADNRINLSAEAPGMGIVFEGRPQKPLVLEGANGLSQKSEGEGEASYYYSYPRIQMGGHLRIGDHDFAVDGLSDGIARDVVFSRPKTAGENDDLRAADSATDGFGQAVTVVANDTLGRDFYPERIELLGQKQRIGIDTLGS